MRLLITSPASVVVDHCDIVSVRAEDESGGFGIMEGHANFLTVLTPSVVSWRGAAGKWSFCAVRRGVLSVRRGTEVAIATRQALLGDSLDHLEEVVLAEFRDAAEAEHAARIGSVQLHMKAIRQIVKYLRPERPGLFGGDG
jgi:F-type H+-transporting ATPase subunit epsilon